MTPNTAEQAELGRRDLLRLSFTAATLGATAGSGVVGVTETVSAADRLHVVDIAHAARSVVGGELASAPSASDLTLRGAAAGVHLVRARSTRIALAGSRVFREVPEQRTRREALGTIASATGVIALNLGGNNILRDANTVATAATRTVGGGASGWTRRLAVFRGLLRS